MIGVAKDESMVAKASIGHPLTPPSQLIVVQLVPFAHQDPSPCISLNKRNCLGSYAQGNIYSPRTKNFQVYLYLHFLFNSS